MTSYTRRMHLWDFDRVLNVNGDVALSNEIVGWLYNVRKNGSKKHGG